MIKSFSFFVLTHFFQFNELKILRQPGYCNIFLQCMCQYIYFVMLMYIQVSYFHSIK